MLLLMTMLTSSCAVLGFASSCEGTEIIGIFEQVGDLVENADVQSADVEVGTVQNIELKGWDAEVTMCVEPSEKVPQDVKLVVRTTSLLGEKFVDIQAQGTGPPFLEDGAILDTDQTGKATELEEVFAKLASILGTGNLEQINRFTTAQANILRDNSDELREVLSRLRRFTDVLGGRQDQIASSVDSLDDVAQTILNDSSVLQQFLASFADSSKVLNRQREGLERLLIGLEDFSNVSMRLLDQIEQGLDRQLRDLRPVLETAVANSDNVRRTLQTLATFVEVFPQGIPGDYQQLDICLGLPEQYGQGVTCAQSKQNDDPNRRSSSSDRSGSTDAEAEPAFDPAAESSLEFILRRPLRGTS